MVADDEDPVDWLELALRVAVALAYAIVELRFHAALGWHRDVLLLNTLFASALPAPCRATGRALDAESARGTPSPNGSAGQCRSWGRADGSPSAERRPGGAGA